MSQTRENLLDGYLRPLLDKYYPTQHIEIRRCLDSLDVFIAFDGQQRRITYEQMRDRESNKILDIAYKIANPHRYPRETTDYFDGRLHIPQRKLVSVFLAEGKDEQILGLDGKWHDPPEPISKRLDAAVLEYAKALCVEVLGKGESGEAFQKLRALYVEIQALEDRCK